MIDANLEAEHQCSDDIRPCDVIETIPKDTGGAFLRRQQEAIKGWMAVAESGVREVLIH